MAIPIYVPYNKGDLMEYAHGWAVGTVPPLPDSMAPDEWRKNESFQAILTLSGIERGRSAARFVWMDSALHQYPMFMIDMLELIQRRQVNPPGVVDAIWIVKKRGANYGVAIYG